MIARYKYAYARLQPRALLSPRVILSLTSLITIIGLSIFAGMLAFNHAKKSQDPEMSPFFKKLLPGGTSACEYESVFRCDACLDCAFANATAGPVAEPHNWEYQWPRDADDLGMSDEMCHAAFPGLFEDVIRAVRDRNGSNVTLDDLYDIEVTNGVVHAIVYDRRVTRNPFRFYFLLYTLTLF